MSLLRMTDVSDYQGPEVMKTNGTLVKATEGHAYKNPKFEAQYASAKRNCDLRGAYHFARPEESSAVSQCDRFLDIAMPEPGTVVMLDLELSKLPQKATNAWAHKFGERLWEKAIGCKTVAYMGSGYATNETGRNLSKSFNFWMYPYYPNAYQLAPGLNLEVQRTANRSSLIPERKIIAGSTNKWPTTMSPWFPSKANTSGWTEPHGWQFTDHMLPGQIDASVWDLSIAQLTGIGGSSKEEDKWFLATSH